jgi:hypothetical protein
MRVTRRRLIVACPTDTPALDADRELAALLPSPPGWLAEHLENGFPTRSEIAAALSPHGGLSVSSNESAASHVRLVRAELSPLLFAPTRAAARLAAAALRRGGRPARVARSLLWRLRGRDAHPAYRSVFVLDISSGR